VDRDDTGIGGNCGARVVDSRRDTLNAVGPGSRVEAAHAGCRAPRPLALNTVGRRRDPRLNSTVAYLR
jgi:hypothetical protein